MTRTVYMINAEDARGGWPDEEVLGEEFETLEQAQSAAFEYVHRFDDAERKFRTVYITKMELDESGCGNGQGVCEIDTETGEPIE